MDQYTYFYLTDKGEAAYEARKESLAAERPTLTAEQDSSILLRLGNSGPEIYQELKDFLLEQPPYLGRESSIRGSLRRLFEAGYIGFD